MKKIIQNKKNKLEFALLTNLSTGENEIFENGKPLNENFKKFIDQINFYYKSKKNGIIKNSNIFLECYYNPVRSLLIDPFFDIFYHTRFCVESNWLCLFDLKVTPLLR